MTNCCNLTLRTFAGKTQVRTKASAVVAADTVDINSNNSAPSDSWKISSNQPIRSFAFNPDSRTSCVNMQKNATASKRPLSSCNYRDADRQPASGISVNSNNTTQTRNGVDHKRLKIIHKNAPVRSCSLDNKVSVLSGRKR